MQKLDKLPDLNNKKTLIIRADKIGSILFASPFMHALRQAYPQAQIDGLFARVQGQVMKYSTDIDNMYLYDKKNWLGFIATLLKLRKNKYDYILMMSHDSKTAGNITRLIPANSKIALAKVKPFFYNVYDYMADIPSGANMPNRYENLAKEIGFTIQSTKPILPITDIERETMEKVFPKNGKRIVFFIGNIDPKKPTHRWQASKYAELVKRSFDFFEKENIIADILVMAGVKDTPLLEDFKDIDSNIYKVYIGTNIHETAALLEKSDLLVCGSTGPAHIAAAMNCPVMSITSQADYSVWKPFGENNLAIFSEDTDVRKIAVDDAFEILKNRLSTWK